MKFLTVFLLAALVSGTCALHKCTVMRAIKQGNVIGIKGYTLGDYMCLVHHASYYDHTLRRSPSEYGIFQINSYWWCNDYETSGRQNLCGMPCYDLLDSGLSDDIACLRRIVRDPNGLDAWSVWTKHCKGRNLYSYTTGC
ncbi:PREDICTED: lysozyme C-like [Nanorana parkeri]|uniref:lysozyme C-like n=1 Tax=Nanorana parkeri TaxID=125878 RepID=UPI000854AF64|nr:PREDICTED: lysozyme C-like [Nanorana parkeri]